MRKDGRKLNDKENVLKTLGKKKSLQTMQREIEDVEEVELSCTAGGRVNWCSHIEKQPGVTWYS